MENIPLDFFLEKSCQKILLHQSTGNSQVWRKSVLRIEIREKNFQLILTLLRAHFISLILKMSSNLEFGLRICAA